jgi:hypothetical protein
MTPKTYRRKAQKKMKRLKYSKCSRCGGHSVCDLINMIPTKKCRECGFVDERFWIGGGMADAYRNIAERDNAREGSNPSQSPTLIFRVKL